MNVSHSLRFGAVLLMATLAIAAPRPVSAAGIPEPSLTLYGKVFNKIGGNTTRLTFGEIRWTFKPLNGGAWVTVTNRLSNINDQFSYVLQVPCESEIVGFAISAGALKVRAAAAAVDRAAVLINAQAVTFVTPAQSVMVLAANERGRIERVDLNIAIAPVDSDGDGLPDDWEQAHFGALDHLGTDDADGDGVSNLAEYQAGTDPNDPNSLFALIYIGAHSQGGIEIKWSSVADKTYAIQRSVNLTTGFWTIATNQPATTPINIYHDTSATNGGHFFYRLQLEQ